MVQELYKRFRPSRFKDVIGQKEAVAVLTTFLKTNSTPHSLLLTGPSGTGKTTLARILAAKLNAVGNDLEEVNAAESRGIDDIRRIGTQMPLSAMGGNDFSRVWILDEAQGLASFAQQALLKILEETPPHVYFMLCSTNPEKLIKPIRTRCVEVKVKSLSETDLKTVLTSGLATEGVQLSEAVFAAVLERAEGSARQAWQLIEKVVGLADDEARLEVLNDTGVQHKAIEIVQALIKDKPKWQDVAKIIDGVQEDPEALRRMVLGYASSVLLKRFHRRAYLILTAFESNWYDSGRAGLVRAAYEVCTG